MTTHERKSIEQIIEDCPVWVEANHDDAMELLIYACSDRGSDAHRDGTRALARIVIDQQRQIAELKRNMQMEVKQMSPRNVSECPWCRLAKDKEIRDHNNKVADAYGEVTLDGYEALKDQEPDPEIADTLKEYYEWEFRDNKFWFRFNFICEECGFSFSHEDTALLPQTPG